MGTAHSVVDIQHASIICMILQTMNWYTSRRQLQLNTDICVKSAKHTNPMIKTRPEETILGYRSVNCASRIHDQITLDSILQVCTSWRKKAGQYQSPQSNILTKKYAVMKMKQVLLRAHVLDSPQTLCGTSSFPSAEVFPLELD